VGVRSLFGKMADRGVQFLQGRGENVASFYDRHSS
jgi:hypothetical protein